MNVRKLVSLAMLAAISIVLMMAIRIPFPLAPFLEYDPADIPIFISAFAFGPGAGLALTFVVSVIQGVTVSASSGIIGILMHFLATGAYVLIAGNIYKHNKTLKRAILSLIAGTVTMTAVMAVCNLIFTPIFMDTPVDAVLAMMLPIIIPFNLMKAGINSVFTLCLYKAVSHFIQGSSAKKKTETGKTM